MSTLLNEHSILKTRLLNYTDFLFSAHWDKHNHNSLFKHFPDTTYPLKTALIISFLYLLAIIPVSFVSPEWIAWENGPVENAQVIILAIGAIYNMTAAQKRSCYKKVFYIAAAFLFLLALREISYGRVFFPTHMESHGPVFVAMKDFPFHTEIYIFLGIYMLLLLHSIIHYIPWHKLMSFPFPTAFFGIAVVCAILSIADDHTWILNGPERETMEELAELLMYSSFLHMSIWYNNALTFPHRKSS